MSVVIQQHLWITWTEIALEAQRTAWGGRNTSPVLVDYAPESAKPAVDLLLAVLSRLTESPRKTTARWATDMWPAVERLIAGRQVDSA